MPGTRARSESADVEVIEVSDGDYAHAVESALAELGLTYRQLAAQAHKGQFTSTRARKLWLTIGRSSCA
jgi:hypothetical protein